MTADSPATPTADQPAATTPTPAAAKPVTWPEWFPAFDTALAVMAVILAFVVSSFVARNADFWRHIAAGRLVTKFEYPFGGDPFTYTAAERVWVNPNWVSEVVLYAAYSADSSGAVAVGVKAIAFAAAFGVLFWLRKPTFPLWPWAVAATLAVVGACSQTHLRPYVFGLLMFSVVLVVLFRGNWTTGGKWRMPLVLAGVVAVWANVDAFAFLAPASIALLLIGEAVHVQLMKGAEEPTPADDPFPVVPPPPALARALGLSVVALLLNPTFLVAVVKDPVEAVAQLVPFELDFGSAAVLSPDRDLSRGTYSALRSEYAKNPLYGMNASGVFAAVVAVLGVVLSAVDYRGGRVSHLVLWLGFVVAAGFLHARFLGPLMLVSVPFLAAHLTALTRRLDLSKLHAQTARTVVSACRAGRVATAFGLVLLGVFAVPGWLQPQLALRPLDRWVAWGADPDEGMRRAAELLNGWRADPQKGEALRDTRGVFTGADLGDYLAWYAPGERGFLTSRYRLHRAELPDLVAVRQILIYLKPKSDPADRPLVELLEKYRADYVCIGQAVLAIQPVSVVVAREEFEGGFAQVQSGAGADSVWHMDGRFAVVGRTDTPDGGLRAKVLAWNVARLAFGPQHPATAADPDLRLGQKPQEGWEYEFLLRPRMPSLEVDDALIFSNYADQRRQTVAFNVQQRAGFWREVFLPAAAQLGGIPLLLRASLDGPPPPKRWDYEYALPVVSVRAARRAVRENPDAARAYYALALAYSQEMVLEAEPGENRTQILTALRRAVARLPDVSEGERTRYTPLYLEIGCRLFRQSVVGTHNQLSEQHLDLARGVLDDVSRCGRAATDEDLANVPVIDMWHDWYTAMWVEFAAQRGGVPNARPPDETVCDILVENKKLDKTDHIREWYPKDQSQFTTDFLRKRLKRLEDLVLESIRWRNDLIEGRGRGLAPEDKFQACIQLGLPGKAIELMDDLRKKSEISPHQVGLLIGLLHRVGQLEDAHGYRQGLEEAMSKLTDGNDPRTQQLRAINRQHELTEAKLAGDYKKADALREEQFRSGAAPPLTEPERKVATLKAGNVVGAVGVLGGGGPMAATNSAFLLLRSRLLGEAEFFFERGLYALLDGDTKLAKQHFDAAAKPQGIPLGDLEVPGQLQPLTIYLPKYRELLERYAK